MDNKCTWLQVYIVIVHLVVYQISKVCIALMYTQHKHTIYRELHIYPYLVLDQTESDNSYSTPLRHEVWNVENKIIILGIDLCYNKSSTFWVQHQHYPEYDTVYMSIFFPWIVFWFSLINGTIFAVIFCQMFLEILS